VKQKERAEMLGKGESGGTPGGAGGQNVSSTQSDDVETKEGGGGETVVGSGLSGLHGEHKSGPERFELTESLTQNFLLLNNSIQQIAGNVSSSETRIRCR
jgi:hypothetical protein